MKHMHAIKIVIYTLTLAILALFLSACGFHLQGSVPLAPALHRLYLQSGDPYGHLTRSLQEYLKISNVQLVDSKESADTILIILQDTTSQDLLSVSPTEQTRQFNLRVTVLFEITDAHAKVLVPAQTMSEARAITIQSNQVLGSSNEANLYYQQMRSSIAYAIMNRISSKEITSTINEAFTPQHKIISRK